MMEEYFLFAVFLSLIAVIVGIIVWLLGKIKK